MTLSKLTITNFEFFWSIWCRGCLQTDVWSGNHKTKYAVLLRLLTQTIEAPKKSQRKTHTKKQKRIIVNKIEIKLQLPIYNFTVQRSVNIALNVANCWSYETPNMPQGLEQILNTNNPSALKFRFEICIQ